MNGKGGVRGRGRGVCQKVLHKCFIEYPNAHMSEMLTKSLGAYKMVQETMFRTTMQNSHKYPSLKLFRKVALKCAKLNPFCEHF